MYSHKYGYHTILDKFLFMGHILISLERYRSCTKTHFEAHLKEADIYPINYAFPKQMTVTEVLLI